MDSPWPAASETHGWHVVHEGLSLRQEEGEEDDDDEASRAAERQAPEGTRSDTHACGSARPPAAAVVGSTNLHLFARIDKERDIGYPQPRVADALVLPAPVSSIPVGSFLGDAREPI